MADHLGLFNADWYLAQNPDVAQAVRLGLITAEEHFTSFGKYEGRAAGPLFNVASYLAANPDVADAVAAGHITAYDHFVLYGVNEGRSPVALFDPNFYLTQNPDVAAAVEAGLISATQHFLLYGMNEPRQINPVINLGTYVTSNADLSQAFNEGTLSPLLHLLLYGVNEGRDLGNGVSLSTFANDPDFQNSASNGDGIAALGRVADVAPFLPTFEAPNGWTPSPNTPIPLDFVPPAGVNLVIPPSIVVPPTTVLPPHFDPVDRDPNPQPDPQPAEPDPDVEDPDVEDPDVEDPDVEDPDVEDPDVEDPDVEDPGTGDPGTGDPGTGDPGTGDPGDGDPGSGDPGDGDPGGYEPVYPAGLEVQETESGFVLINTADQSLYITGIEFNGNEINIAGKKGDEGWNLLTYSQISAVMTGEHPLFITPAVVDAMRVAGIKVDGEGMVVVSATDVAGSFDITNIQPTVKLQVHETTADQHIIMRADQATGVSGEGSVTVLSTSEATTIFVNTTGTNLLDPGKGGDSILLHDGGGDDTIRVRTGEMSDDAKIAIQVARDNLASFEDENGDQATLNDKFLTATNIENARDALKLTLDDANQDVSDDELIHGNYAKVQGDFDDAEQALSNHMAKGSIEDLNTHRDTVSGQLDERGLLQTALDNANSELSNHGDRDTLESDLSDAQAVQTARETLRLNQQSAQDALSIHVQDHGEDADLSAAVDSATSAIDARQQLINERTDAEAQLNAHVSNFGEDADLHDSATQARANSSERESLSTAVDVAQDLVDTRDDLQEAVDIANAALTTHVTEKGDETALQDAIDAAELILSERESLKEAVTTASVNLISHMGSYGTDTVIADALANAESDLNTHASTPVKEQSLQDLADAVTAAQTALIADPDNEDLQLALQDAESVHSARQVLEDALSNAQDDLDNHLTATGKTTSELEQAMQDAIAARDANPDEDTEQAVIDATEAYNTRVSLEQAVSEAELDLQTHRESTKIPLTLAELQQEILDLEAALSSDPDNEALQTELQSLTEVRDIRVNLENAWNSALQLFDDREILNTAVQTADSNLSAHMHHGDDDELSDTVAAAHAELVHRGVLLSNQDNAVNDYNTFISTQGPLDANLSQAKADLQDHIDLYGDADALAQAIADADLLVTNRDGLRLALTNAEDALTLARSEQSDADLDDDLDAANLNLSDRAQLTTAVQDATALIDAHIDDFGDDDAVQLLIDTAQALLNAYDNALSAVTTAQVQLDFHVGQFGPTQDLQDALDAVLADITLRGELEDAFSMAETTLANRDALLEAVNDALDALNDHVLLYGDDDQVSDAIAKASADLLTHTTLLNSLDSAVAAGMDAISPSESFWLPGDEILSSNMDDITFFNPHNDRLDLDSTTIVDDASNVTVGAVTFSIQNGLATFTTTQTYGQALEALATYLGDSTETVAFWNQATLATYVLQGDGYEGLQSSDVVIRLSGVKEIDNLADIIV